MNMKRIGVLVIIALLYVAYPVLGYGFDVDAISKKYKNELKTIKSDAQAKTFWFNHAKEAFGVTSNWLGFFDGLSGGTYIGEIEYLMQLPNDKLWACPVARQWLVLKNSEMVKVQRNMPLTQNIGKAASYMGYALSAYSLASDIRAGLDGDDAAKLRAIQTSYDISLTVMIQQLGLESLGLAMAGVKFIGYALDKFIKFSFDSKREYWYGGYEAYYEKKYNFTSWKELAEQQGGEALLEQRLQEFWSDPINNTIWATGQNPPALWGSEPVGLMLEKYKKEFMVDYYTFAIHTPLKNHFTRQAEMAEALAEIRAEMQHARMQQMIVDVDIVRQAVEWAKKQKEKQVDSVRVYPGEAKLLIGEKMTFSASAKYKDGTIETITDDPGVSWSGGEKNIFLASTEGTFTLTATYEGVSGSAAITVGKGKEVDKVVVTPGPVTLRIGEKKTFTATAHFTDQTTENVSTKATWTGGDDNVFTAVKSGQFTISAEYGEKTGSAMITVPELVEVEVSPHNPEVEAGGDPISFGAKAIYKDGYTQNITGKAAWTGGQQNVFYPPATIDDTVDYKVIMAEFGGLSGRSTIKITAQKSSAALSAEDREKISQILQRLGEILSELYLVQFGFESQYDAFMSAVSVAQSGQTNQDPCDAGKLYYAHARGLLQEARNYRREAQGLKSDLPALAPPPDELVSAQAQVDKDLSTIEGYVSGMESKFSDMTTTLTSLGCDAREVALAGEEELSGRSDEDQERTTKHDEKHQDETRPSSDEGCVPFTCGAGAAVLFLPAGVLFVRMIDRKKKYRA
jgi:hypothetical protein